MRAITCSLLLALSLMACVTKSPRKQLADTVHRMNDAARWGRTTTVTSVVQPDYLQRFLKSRSTWGEDIQLADTEVVEVQMAPDEQAAVSVVTYSWYSMRTMTLHKTTVQQHWARIDDSDDFALEDEQVVKGNAELFTLPEDDDAEKNG